MVDQQEQLRLEGRKVLVVDDDTEVRAAIDNALQAEGALTQTCGDGNTAVRICEVDPPDLVVLDWMLPGLSGIEVCRQLKAGRDTAAIPVIMLSARSEEVDKLRGLEIGADDYVTKPYSVAERLAREDGNPAHKAQHPQNNRTDGSDWGKHRVHAPI